MLFSAVFDNAGFIWNLNNLFLEFHQAKFNCIETCAYFPGSRLLCLQTIILSDNWLFLLPKQGKQLKFLQCTSVCSFLKGISYPARGCISWVLLIIEPDIKIRSFTVFWMFRWEKTKKVRPIFFTIQFLQSQKSCITCDRSIFWYGWLAMTLQARTCCTTLFEFWDVLIIP